MVLLLAGGSGFIGRALNHFYRSKGVKIIVVTREPKGKNQIDWSEIKRNGLPANVQWVINLCGRNIGELSPLYLVYKYYQTFKKDLFESRLSTTKLLVDSIKAASNPPKLFINSSAIGIYKPSLTATYTEEEPYVDYNMITQLCKEWEAAANIPGMPQIRQIQLRTGLVLGSGGGMLQSMYIPFKLGLGGPIGCGDQLMSWIHMDDIIGIIDHIKNNETISSGPLNATAPHPVTNKEFASTLGATLNRPAILAMPSFSINVLFGERATLLLDGHRVIPQKILNFGYTFKYTHLSEALRAVYH